MIDHPEIKRGIKDNLREKPGKKGGFIMIRISEEQKAILNCYSGTKEEVAAVLMIAIPFIEDTELKASAYELLENLSLMSEREYKVSHESVLFEAVYNGEIVGNGQREIKRLSGIVSIVVLFSITRKILMITSIHGNVRNAGDCFKVCVN